MSRAKRLMSRGRGKPKVAKLYPSQRLMMGFTSNVKEQLEAFVGNLKEQAFRPAAYAAATFLYYELRYRTEGGNGDGTLRDAIYRFRVKEDIGNKAIFYAGVNKTKAPHWWVVENGRWQYYTVIRPTEGPYAGQYVTLKNKPLPQPKFVPAKPYLRPTADKLPQALQVAMRVLKERTNYLIRGVNGPAIDAEYELY